MFLRLRRKGDKRDRCPDCPVLRAPAEERRRPAAGAEAAREAGAVPAALRPPAPHPGEGACAPRPRRRALRAAAWALSGAVTVAALAVLSGRLAVTLTPSMEHRVWFLNRVASPAEIRKGDAVMFLFRDPHGFVGEAKEAKEKGGKAPVERRAIKRVACAPGELLQEDGRDFRCGGWFIGRARELSRDGRPAPLFRFSGVIPEGKYFVMGDGADSYDSRYFGFVEAKDVQALARPVF